MNETGKVTATVQSHHKSYSLNAQPLLIEGDSAASTPDLPRLRAGCGRAGEAYIAHSLSSEGADASEDGTGRGVPLVFESTVARNGRGAPDEIVRALRASEDGGRTDCKPLVMAGGIRRLTPRECLRLQSLPGHWLDLDPPLSDSAKYRMIGNSVAVPVLEWIGKRSMQNEESRPACPISL